MGTEPKIGDDAVKAKTGKVWPEWFSLLDKAGAKKMTHKEIVVHLSKRHRKLGGWWTQMVTVAYEQARGLRDKHEKPGGYEISSSKTVAAPIDRLFAAWNDKRRRGSWLPGEEIVIRKATPQKSMRITWSDGKTHVDAYFCAKGDAKSQIAVQHKKLSSSKEAAGKKAYWSERLGALKDYLEAT